MPPFDRQIDSYALLAAMWRLVIPIGVVVALVLGLGYFALSRVPRSYDAMATLLVEPRQSGAETLWDGLIDSTRMSTIVMLMRSPEAMELVAEREGLAELPEFGGGANPAGMGEMIRRLEERVVVVAGRGTAMIYVRARAGNPDLARRLALAVAQAGLDLRVSLIEADIGQAQGWLDGTLIRLRAETEAAEQALSEYLATHGMVRDAGAVSLDQLQRSNLDTQVGQARERAARAAAQAEIWRQWQRSGDARARSSLADEAGRALLQDHAALEAQIAGTSARLGSDHPSLLAMRGQARDIEARIDAAVDAAIAGAEGQAQAERALVERLEEEMLAGRDAMAATEGESPELAALRREATALRNVLNTYLARNASAIAAGQSGSVLPDLRIISHPMTPIAPATPRTGLVLAALGIVTLMVILAVLIVIGQARRPVRLA